MKLISNVRFGIAEKLLRGIKIEDIKKMKAIKADILSITPVLPEDESEDFSASDLKEQPFDELVKNFYRKKFHVDIGEETFSLLMSIIEEN